MREKPRKVRKGGFRQAVLRWCSPVDLGVLLHPRQVRRFRGRRRPGRIRLRVCGMWDSGIDSIWNDAIPAILTYTHHKSRDLEKRLGREGEERGNALTAVKESAFCKGEC